MSLDLSDPEVAQRVLMAAMSAPEDPTKTGPYPRGLALDLILGTCSLKDVPAVYDMTPQEVADVVRNPLFRREYDRLAAEMEKDGWAFKQKAAAQAEALLETTWRLIHDGTTPANVRADLIKQTVKWAGLEPQATPQAQNAIVSGSVSEAVQALRQMDDAELEIRVAQILVRKGGGAATPESREQGAFTPSALDALTIEMETLPAPIPAQQSVSAPVAQPLAQPAPAAPTQPSPFGEVPAHLRAAPMVLPEDSINASLDAIFSTMQDDL